MEPVGDAEPCCGRGRLVLRILPRRAFDLQQRLAATRAEIARVEPKLDRNFEAFESGDLSAALCYERVRGHRQRLEALREQEADLARRLATHGAHAAERGRPRQPR